MSRSGRVWILAAAWWFWPAGCFAQEFRGTVLTASGTRGINISGKLRF